MKVIIGIVVALFLWLIYFATQMSATYAPLKSYQYHVTSEVLQERLFQTVGSNPNMTLQLTDNVRTEKGNFHYYAHIMIEDSTEKYMFIVSYYKKDSSWDNNFKSEVSLIGALDILRRTGGYKSEDTDVEKLMAVFENQVIDKIDKNSSRQQLRLRWVWSAHNEAVVAPD